MIRGWVEYYRSRGWSPVRLQELGKAPTDHGWPDRVYTSEDFAPTNNVGIQVGPASHGLVDVDLDCVEAVALAPLYLPPTATFGRSGKPRSHWIYICPELAQWRGIPTTHVELRCKPGTQTAFPPSVWFDQKKGAIHPEPIAWETEPEPITISERDLVSRVGALMVATLIARTWPHLQANQVAHHAMLAIAGALYREGWPEDFAAHVVLPAAELAGGPDTGHREGAIRSTWEDSDKERTGWPTVTETWGVNTATALRRAVELVGFAPRGVVPIDPAIATSRACTDAGNAERLKDDYGDDLRYVCGAGWSLWDGTRWNTTGDEPMLHAILSARKLQALARETGNGPLLKFANAQESAGKINATIQIMHGTDRRTLPEHLDRDPWSLNCPNGIVDLRTGSLRPHDRSEFHTLIAGVPYEPTMPCPRFGRFLLEIFDGDRDLAAYMLRWLGYSLTGRVTERKLQLWVGTGSNGKSTLVELMLHLLGITDYARKLPNEMLIQTRARSSNEASPAIVALRGCRATFGSEQSQGQRWNEALVKELTGGDSITGRGLYSDPITFRPSWKIAIAVNHKPEVRGTDHGIWSRIHLVPFDCTFPGDPLLFDTLVQEGPGILGALVRGCLDWQHGGLGPPARVIAEVKAYRSEQDTVGAFLSECLIADGGARTPKSQVYRVYSAWSRDGNEFTMGKQAFNRILHERGIQQEGTQWIGIKVRPGV